ncbi:MAG: hypothetical protein JKX68_12775 [Flavobacteriales bacterium]|nr:hypothetical protein [Flavobacteriales bacterium]
MMNKLLLNITTIFFILVLFSCAGEDMKNDNISTETAKSTTTETDEPKEIISVLERGDAELTSEQKEAFQLRAIQKIEDFIDYLRIISDPKVNNDLKEHSYQLALGLFINDSTFFSDSAITNPSNSIFLTDYLTKMKSRKNPFTVNIKNIQFSEKLELDSLNIYKGSMIMSLGIKQKTVVKNIDVHLLEIQKIFGDSTLAIMEVRLGNIY